MDYLLENFIFLLFLVGTIYLIAAVISSIFPPKKINYFYGYRTNQSMKNQLQWDFAQKKSNKEMINSGFLMLLFSTIPFFIKLTETQNMIVGIFFIILFTFSIFYRTKKLFKKSLIKNNLKMKLKFFIISIFFLFQNIFAQEIVGSWKGDLEIQGMKLPLILHIKKEKTGYSSTLDSPNQSSFGILVDKTTFTENVLTIEVAKLNLKYSGTLKNQIISGLFSQNNFQTDLVLKPFDKDSKKMVTVKELPKDLTKNLDNIEKLLSYYEANQYDAGSISIFKNGKEIFFRNFGEKNLPNSNSKNRFLQIGSITKTYTSVMLNQLVQENKLSLSEKLSKFYPKIPNADKINIRQMLNHTSGLGDYVEKGDDYYWLKKPATEAQIFENMESQTSLFEPGTSSSYSNTAYYLLTKIIENVTGKSYAQNLQERILTPLKLKETFSASQNPKNVFPPYKYEGNWKIVDDFDFNNVIGVGDIAANPTDVNTFINALFDGKLVSQNTLGNMVPEKNQKFGLGILVVPFYNKYFYGHSGGTYGTNSLMIYNPEDKISISYSLNASRIDSNTFVIGILSLLYGMDYEFPKINNQKISEEQIQKIGGDYSSTQLPLEIKIFAKDGQLFAQGTGQPEFPLELVSENTYKFDGANIKVTFFPEKKEMKFQQNGMEFQFKKK